MKYGDMIKTLFFINHSTPTGGEHRAMQMITKTNKNKTPTNTIPGSRAATIVQLNILCEWILTKKIILVRVNWIHYSEEQ